MAKVLGILLTAIFAAIALLHIYWALGGSTSNISAVPTVEGKQAFTPSTFGTLMVAAAFVMAIFVVLGQFGFLGALVPHWIFRTGLFTISVIFLLRAIGEFKLVGFFKSVTGTPFAAMDTGVFSPLCLAIAVMAFVVAYKDVSDATQV
jgi:Protein of unknown function (DUF3995)